MLLSNSVVCPKLEILNNNEIMLGAAVASKTILILSDNPIKHKSL